VFVLGLSGGYGHDPAAALVHGSTIIAAAEEERFTRRKHAFGQVPVSAAAYCLSAGGITLDEVDCIALAWQPEHPPPWPTKLHEDLLAHPLFRGQRRPRVEVVPHPLAHAAVAFRTSALEEASILVVDGQGDGISTTLAHGTRDGITLIEHYGIEQSLGFFYWALTSFLGWEWGQEGKVMGLAPYGSNGHGAHAFELFSGGYAARIDPAPAEGHWQRGRSTFSAWQQFLEREHGAPARVRYALDPMSLRPRPTVEITEREKAIAAWGQGELERVLCHVAQVLVERTGCPDLVLGGGVAYNCAANGRLRAEAGIRDLYLFPSSGDAGTSIGAAFAVAGAGKSGPDERRIEHASFGPGFDDEVIDRFLRSNGVAAHRSDDVVGEAAAMLAADQVVGWFQGRMELGPRALGSRSILASPLSRKTRDRVNAIKGREVWRPLAPSLLGSAAADYLADPRPSPFMLMATTVREDRRDRIPAVVHVDGSCRPQTVAEGAGTRFADLLARMGQEAGVPVVLNTSFNIGDEPIVLSPRDAVRSFFASGLDALVIGDSVVRKRL
jgi:carbamoyltransferase